MIKRMRRLRKAGVRDLVAENRLSVKSMIQPIFVDERLSQPKPIDSMPGQYRQSLDSVAGEAAELEDLGVPAVLLFGLPAHKDEIGSGSYDPQGVIQKAVEKVKRRRRTPLQAGGACEGAAA